MEDRTRRHRAAFKAGGKIFANSGHCSVGQASRKRKISDRAIPRNTAIRARKMYWMPMIL
jgi:hypothetical protein